MNYLVHLDAQAGELEKILSGVKTMLVKKNDPAQNPPLPVHPGDSLYFLRDQDDCNLRVKAAVVRVLICTRRADEDLAHILKEFQPRLQLTEDQFYYWSAADQVQLVELGFAQKIAVIHVAPGKIPDRPDWMPFEELGWIATQEA